MADMQMVNITIRVLSKPDATQLRWIFRTLGKGEYLAATCLRDTTRPL
jgi:hypothetical protein